MSKSKTSAPATEEAVDVVADVMEAPAPAAAEANDVKDVLGAILARMEAMQEQINAKDTENDRLRAEVAAATAAAQRAASDPATRPMAAPDAWVEVRGDGPERNVDRKLDAMQRSAELENEPFDRERTRKILLGLPVDDIQFLCETCGTAPEPQTQAAFEAHQSKHELEAGRVIGKRR